MIALSTEEYDKLRKKYNDYRDIYKFFNGGSLDGVTPWDEFYWRFLYRIHYENPENLGASGY